MNGHFDGSIKMKYGTLKVCFFICVLLFISLPGCGKGGINKNDEQSLLDALDKSDDDGERILAMGYLADMNSEKAKPLVVKALNDENKDVVLAAISTVRKMHISVAQPVLIDIANSRDTDQKVRARALRTAAYIFNGNLKDMLWDIGQNKKDDPAIRLLSLGLLCEALNIKGENDSGIEITGCFWAADPVIRYMCYSIIFRDKELNKYYSKWNTVLPDSIFMREESLCFKENLLALLPDLMKNKQYGIDWGNIEIIQVFSRFGDAVALETAFNFVPKKSGKTEPFERDLIENDFFEALEKLVAEGNKDALEIVWQCPFHYSCADPEEDTNNYIPAQAYMVLKRCQNGELKLSDFICEHAKLNLRIGSAVYDAWKESDESFRKELSAIIERGFEYDSRYKSREEWIEVYKQQIEDSGIIFSEGSWALFKELLENCKADDMQTIQRAQAQLRNCLRKTRWKNISMPVDQAGREKMVKEIYDWYERNKQYLLWSGPKYTPYIFNVAVGNFLRDNEEETKQAFKAVAEYFQIDAGIDGDEYFEKENTGKLFRWAKFNMPYMVFNTKCKRFMPDEYARMCSIPAGKWLGMTEKQKKAAWGDIVKSYPVKLQKEVEKAFEHWLDYNRGCVIAVPSIIDL